MVSWNRNNNQSSVCKDHIVRDQSCQICFLTLGNLINLVKMLCFHLTKCDKSCQKVVFTLGNVTNPVRKFCVLISLSDSDHDGLGQTRSGSASTADILRWKSRITQSIIRMMRWGGLASLRTEKYNNTFMTTIISNFYIILHHKSYNIP